MSIYKRAAIEIEEGYENYSCCAIEYQYNKERPRSEEKYAYNIPEVIDYLDLMNPKLEGDPNYSEETVDKSSCLQGAIEGWHDEKGIYIDFSAPRVHDDDAARDLRVMLLLMAHEVLAE